MRLSAKDEEASEGGTMQLIDFFLNKKEQEKQDVTAPAFSITKVLGAAAIIVAPIATLVVDATTKVDLSEDQFVTLALGLLAFVAVITAADVVARAYVTGQKARQVAHMAPLQRALPAHMGRKTDVRVIATVDGDEPAYLVMQDETLKVVSASKVQIG
jgi:hypothetical protein